MGQATSELEQDTVYPEMKVATPLSTSKRTFLVGGIGLSR